VPEATADHQQHCAGANHSIRLGLTVHCRSVQGPPLPGPRPLLDLQPSGLGCVWVQRQWGVWGRQSRDLQEQWGVGSGRAARGGWVGSRDGGSV
jgi:hypothetical protein